MPMMREFWTPFKIVGVRYFKDKDNGVYYRKVGKGSRKEVRPLWRLKRFYGLTTVAVIGIVGFVGYEVVIDKASDQLFAEVSKDVTPEDMTNLLHDKDVQQLLKDELGDAKASGVLEKYGVLSTDAPASVVNAGQSNSSDSTSQATNVNGAVATSQSTNGQASTASQNSDSNEDSSNTGNSSSTGNSSQGSTSASSSASTAKDGSKPGSQPQASSQQGNSSTKTESKASTKNPPKKSTGLRFKSREEATRFVLSKFSMSEINKVRTLMQGGVTPDEKAYIKGLVYSRLSASELQALKAFSVVEMTTH